MAKNFIQAGSVVTLPAPAAVVSGSLVKVGVICGVALHSAASGEPVELRLDGVFSLKKTSAQAWTVGAAIYLIPATGLCTTATTAGNLFVGHAVEAAANPTEFGLVRLNGGAAAAVTS